MPIVEFVGSKVWEVYDGHPIVGLFPPQRYPFEPVCPIWASYVVMPGPMNGYSRVAEENARYFREEGRV